MFSNRALCQHEAGCDITAAPYNRLYLIHANIQLGQHFCMLLFLQDSFCGEALCVQLCQSAVHSGLSVHLITTAQTAEAKSTTRTYGCTYMYVQFAELITQNRFMNNDV